MLSLPSLPPPPSSLLPPLSHATDPTLNQSQHPHHHHHPHHPHRRHKNAPNPRAPLPMLTQEERLLTSRKTAIAMYGYSWLKPAGCTKTMLGRREEEIEREEVERQLREVEMQDRVAQEADEGERQARTREMRERGEVVGEGERDLDDDVPDADQTRGTFEEGEGMAGDLDDEIPDADGSEEDEDDEDDEDEDEGEGDASGAFGEGWTYDSRREPDSDEEEDIHERLARSDGRFSHLLPQPQTQQQRGVPRANVVRAAAALGFGRAQEGDYGYNVDEREAASLADAMLDEDEMGEVSFDQEPQDMTGGDLDDDVPDAEEGGWEHTDTELEESEMDISILPGEGRRSSRVPLPIPGSGRTSARQGAAMQGTRVISGNAAHQLQQQFAVMQSMRTPVLDANALLTTSSAMGGSEASALATGDNEAAFAQNQGTRRNWLNAASARRNLFGASRLGRAPSGTASGSGGLFTPSPRQEQEPSPEADDGQDGPAHGHRRRRSGRLLDAMGVGRRRGENRDSVD